MPERKPTKGLGPSYDAAPNWTNKDSTYDWTKGEADDETKRLIQRHDEILSNVGNFRNEPWKATKEFFHLWPFNEITERSQAGLGFRPGVTSTYGPQVLEEQLKKYFGRK